MKVDAKALFEVVRQVVQDEIRKSLPGMVRQHLTESYMKKLVQEQIQPATKPAARRQPTMTELLMTPKGDEELEEVPEPLSNSDEGIYAPGLPGLKKEEVVSKLLSKNSNLHAYMFEGVKPIPREDDASAGAPPSIPLEKVGFNFSGMNKLVEGMEKRSSQQGETSTAEMKMRELEAKRKALEVKAG